MTRLNKERDQDIADMKGRLLNNARREPVLKRKEVSRMEKEDLMTSVEHYMLMFTTAFNVVFGENMFAPSSFLSITLEEIVEGTESFTGKKVFPHNRIFN